MEGRKDDKSKLRYDLLDAEFEEGLVEVLTFGAEKYADNNWRKVERPCARYYSALRRHLAAWRRGERLDPESGLSHLAHAACNLYFLDYFDREVG